tara:strand:- start:210 stop:416 length:207 start_codon:yes stop_codon:yes gene_type:complete
MPAGKGTYGNKVGRPSNKRTGEDFLDREEKKKNKKSGLWNTMKRDIMKSEISKKKKKTIQDMLKEMNR